MRESSIYGIFIGGGAFISWGFGGFRGLHHNTYDDMYIPVYIQASMIFPEAYDYQALT
jgi:hypothetical protein